MIGHLEPAVRERRHSAHDHEHPRGVPLRSRAVGMMHGLAGSAALVVVAAAALSSPLEGLIYVALFGLGSVGGMALLSFAIAVPMRLTANVLTWTHRGLQGGIGCATIVLGGVIIITYSASASSSGLGTVPRCARRYS